MARGIEFLFDASTRAMARGLKAGNAALADMSDQARKTDLSLRAIKEPEIKPSLDQGAMLALRARLKAQKEQIERDLSDINVDVDTFEATRKLRRIEAELRRLDRMDVDVNVDVDRNNLLLIQNGLRGITGGMASLAETGPAGLAVLAGIGGAIASSAALLGPGTVGAGIAAGIGLLGKGLLESVGQYEAGRRRYATVFGQQADDIEEWARSVSTRGGLGLNELQDLAAGVQDLLVPQGYSRKDASDITKQITERGIALAEWTGRDKVDGIDAVTKALLGEREMLKGFGISIRQKEVNDWIKDNEKSLGGLSDAQKTTAATLALVEQKSKDAFDAYQSGGSTAEQALDSLRSKVETFKTDVTAGLSGPIQAVLESIDLSGEANPLDTIVEWINQNQATITKFFIDLGLLAVTGADAFLTMSATIVTALAALQPAFAGITTLITSSASTTLETLALIADAANALGPLAGPLASLVPQGYGDKLRDQAQATRDFGDAANQAGEDFANVIAPGILETIGSARDGLGGLKDELLGLSDEQVLNLRVAIEQGNLRAARQEVDDLTDAQLIDIFTSIDPDTKNASEATLLALVKDRLAEMYPDVDFTKEKEAQRKLENLAKSRDSKVNPKLGDTSRVNAGLAGLTADRTVKITPELTTRTLGGVTVIGNIPKYAVEPSASSAPVNLVRVSIAGSEVESQVQSVYTRTRETDRIAAVLGSGA